MTQPIIQVSHLWKLFGPEPLLRRLNGPGSFPQALKAGAVAAVRDLSFGVMPGEIFVVMGLSGSGKSTLIRSLLRLIEPTWGRVEIGGIDVTALDGRGLTQFRRTKVAMIFQHYGLLPHKTVLENAAFGLKLRGVPQEERRAKAQEVLARVGLKGWEDQLPGALSGGMRQRVGIARALATDAEILLMDEPFSGLDPLIRTDMQNELLRLQGELKKTILFVTHDLREAARLGDRMAVMRSGRFVQVGTPDEILRHPANEYVARFVQSQDLPGREKSAERQRVVS